MYVEQFTYESYETLLKNVVDSGYTFTNYHAYKRENYPCILRHDIDFSLKKAARVARLEAGLELGQRVRSTWFVLLNTAFYNVCDSDQRKLLFEMMGLGHEIGLHYDETKYDTGQDAALIAESVEEEAHLLGRLLGVPIRAFSFHRPSKQSMEGDIVIPELVNSYGATFFHEFKYLSDSRFNWREDVEAIVRERRYGKLHLLTHAFSYTEKPQTPKEKLRAFARAACDERYETMAKNIRSIDELLKKEEL